MKKMSLYILVVGSYALSIMAMNIPERSKRSASVLKNTEENLPTSPSKGMVISPEAKRQTRRQLFPTGYTDTEHELALDERLERIPVLTAIDNNFNYPILIGLPHIEAQSLRPLKSLALNNLRIIAPQQVIISANNKIYTLRYLARTGENYFLLSIDDGVESELEIAAKKVKIEIDKRGDLLLKPQ